MPHVICVLNARAFVGEMYLKKILGMKVDTVMEVLWT